MKKIIMFVVASIMMLTMIAGCAQTPTEQAASPTSEPTSRSR